MMNHIYDQENVSALDPRYTRIAELNGFKKRLKRQLLIATIVGAALSFLFFIVTSKFILARKIAIFAVPVLYFLFLLRVKRVHNILIQNKKRELTL